MFLTGFIIGCHERQCTIMAINLANKYYSDHYHLLKKLCSLEGDNTALQAFLS